MEGARGLDVMGRTARDWKRCLRVGGKSGLVFDVSGAVPAGGKSTLAFCLLLLCLGGRYSFLIVPSAQCGSPPRRPVSETEAIPAARRDSASPAMRAPTAAECRCSTSSVHEFEHLGDEDVYFDFGRKGSRHVP